MPSALLAGSPLASVQGKVLELSAPLQSSLSHAGAAKNSEGFLLSRSGGSPSECCIPLSQTQARPPSHSLRGGVYPALILNKDEHFFFMMYAAHCCLLVCFGLVFAGRGLVGRIGRNIEDGFQRAVRCF